MKSPSWAALLPSVKLAMAAGGVGAGVPARPLKGMPLALRGASVIVAPSAIMSGGS